MASPALLVVPMLLLIAGVAGRQMNSLSQFLHQPPNDGGTRWAVLVAGSNGYENYRHQADVCHAYRVLKSGGLMDTNIIVFMYDDIARNPQNPQQGVIINYPEWDDVYAGVPKDYTGNKVNVKNFRAVLLGDKSANPGSKVVDSGPDDHIFVFFSGLGGAGYIALLSERLYADVLVQTLKTKHAAGKYKGLVFYLEASYAGSMFEGVLPGDINAYATTASNRFEESYATYCGTPGYPTTCLGDLYSVAWMEQSQLYDRRAISLKTQYDTVEARTAPSSHVMLYGDSDMLPEKLAVYQGFPTTLHSGSYNSSSSTAAVTQRDAHLLYLWHMYQESAEGSSEKSQARNQLAEELARRSRVDTAVEMIGVHLFGPEEGPKLLNAVRPAGKPLVDDWDCLRSMVRSFEDKCGTLGHYGMKHTAAFANMCNAGVGAEIMSNLASQACSPPVVGPFEY